MTSRTMRRTLLVVALAAVAALLPATGQATPPESDDSAYTWAGAAKLTVDVKPWGGGYVRSDPYLIDCPGACIRSFDQGREVQLTAYMTPGHTFKAWEGACAGQGNPCTLKLTGAAIDVTAVLTGQYVAPKPPTPKAPATTVNPGLTVEHIDGTCPECFYSILYGTGFNPNSPISVTFVFSSPTTEDQRFPNVETSNADGAWTQAFYEECIFGGAPYHGAVEAEAIATDAAGASASAHDSGVCP